MRAFYDVEAFDSETFTVVAYRAGPQQGITAAEVAIVSAYGHWTEDDEQRMGSDGKPCRSESRAQSDAHEIAGALNGGLMCAGVFDDSLPEQYAKQEKARKEGGAPPAATVEAEVVPTRVDETADAKTLIVHFKDSRDADLFQARVLTKNAGGGA